MSTRGPTALAGAPSTAPRRICPLCDALLSAELCPADGTSTLSLDAPSSDPQRMRPGRIIADRYRVEAAIGSGGFSKVFRAVHNGTGQNVALKVLGGGGLEDTSGLRRFFREARASAGLRHPNTVRVFDFGQEEDGVVFLAMELLTGQTLRGLQRARMEAGGAISEREVVEIAIAVTQSLGEAHSLGLVHRDIGPNNIFLHEVSGSDRVVKLLDFGLVKDGGLRPLTMGTDICGTVSYMSPEHMLGHRVTPRSDLYSLAITLWWALAGERPFRGESHREVMRGHLQDPLPKLSAHARTPVSPELEAVIERAAAKDPAERYEDAAAMRIALEACLQATRERTQRVGAMAEVDRTLHLVPATEVVPATVVSAPVPEISAPPERRSRAWAPAGAVLGIALAMAVLAWPEAQATPPVQVVTESVSLVPEIVAVPEDSEPSVAVEVPVEVTQPVVSEEPARPRVKKKRAPVSRASILKEKI